LKTSDKTQDRERFNVEFIAHAHDTRVQFGHDEVKTFPCSYGLNENAGMNAEELEKHFYKGSFPFTRTLRTFQGKGS